MAGPTDSMVQLRAAFADPAGLACFNAEYLRHHVRVWRTVDVVLNILAAGLAGVAATTGLADLVGTKTVSWLALAAAVPLAVKANLRASDLANTRKKTSESFERSSARRRVGQSSGPEWPVPEPPPPESSGWSAPLVWIAARADGWGAAGACATGGDGRLAAGVLGSTTVGVDVLRAAVVLECSLDATKGGRGCARGGASPWMTEIGSDERPMCSAARRLTDQVRPAVTAIPSNAATAHIRPRRVNTIAIAP